MAQARIAILSVGVGVGVGVLGVGLGMSPWAAAHLGAVDTALLAAALVDARRPSGGSIVPLLAAVLFGANGIWLLFDGSVWLAVAHGVWASLYVLAGRRLAMSERG